MLQNYFIVGWRNLLRHRTYTLANLLGLTVSLMFSLLIGNFILNEIAVDQDLRHSDRQYMLQSRWREKDMGSEIGSLAPFGPTLKQRYPNLIANYYRCYGVGAIVSRGQQHFREQIQIGDTTLFSMYGFGLMHGDPAIAFREPNSVVLTEAAAQKYFGKTDVLRQQITIQTPIGGKQVVTVTGVLPRLPENSVTHLYDFAPQFFLSVGQIGYFTDEAQMRSWENRTIITYLETQPGVSAIQLDQPLAQTLRTYASPAIHQNLTAYLSPLQQFHLKANNGLIEKMILTLLIVTLFIVGMAVVNFVNITIGTSAARVREIGVRKALGGLKRQVMGQFLTEAFLLTSGAVLCALLGHELFRSTLSDVFGKPLTPLLHWPLPAFLAVFGVIVGMTLLAGFYPAFILSRLPTVASIKGKIGAAVPGRVGVRQAFIVFQFTVALTVFIGAVVIDEQVTFFFNKELGYQKEQILSVSSVPRDWSSAGVQRMETIRNQLARTPGVEGVSLSFEIPDGSSSGSLSMFPLGGDSTRAVVANSLTADEHYAQTYGLRMRAGQFFNANGGSYDSLRVVLNESAVKALGWQTPTKALGQLVQFWGDTYRIGGVAADFHTGSLRESIRPLVFVPIRKNPIYRYFSFRLARGELPQTVRAIEANWRKLLPDAPFDYAFMDQTLQALYQTELQLQKAARLATALALLIVLLGVFGLVSLSVTQRTKEIGIRKVLGASVPGIIGLFAREFAVVILVSSLIACPLVYYFTTGWLAQFTYRVSLTWFPFVAVTLALVSLTGLVVGSRVLRATLMSPVKSLRMD